MIWEPDHCHVTDKSDCWRQEDCPIACITYLSRKFSLQSLQSQNYKTEQYFSSSSALISRLPCSNSSACDLFRSSVLGFCCLRLPRFAPGVIAALTSCFL